MAFRKSATADAELRRLIAPAMREIATKLAEKAAELAPDGDRARGNRQSYRAVVNGKGWVVGSTDPNAHIIEFGTEDTIEYAPMRRAVRALDLKLNNPGRAAGRSGRIRGANRQRRGTS